VGPPCKLARRHASAHVGAACLRWVWSKHRRLIQLYGLSMQAHCESPVPPAIIFVCASLGRMLCPPPPLHYFKILSTPLSLSHIDTIPSFSSLAPVSRRVRQNARVPRLSTTSVDLHRAENCLRLAVVLSANDLRVYCRRPYFRYR